MADVTPSRTVHAVQPPANLAVRHRPRRFSELTGQRHVAAVIKGAVKAGSVPQQILLTGGSGLGKTTVARIAAAAALCTTPIGQREDGDSCGGCDACVAIGQPTCQHPDVIELDAASHGTKEEIVAMVARAQTRPLQGPYKVYIIDEVHAISGAGAQAFLKLLEEPPAHVLFMLATTNPEKLSSRAGGTGTIRGRCMEFELVPPEREELVQNLLRIADREGWKLPAEVAELVVDVSEPALGVRGTINTLAKLAHLLEAGGGVDVDVAASALGALTAQQIDLVTGAVRRRDLAGAVTAAADVRKLAGDSALRAALLRWARGALEAALRGDVTVSLELALSRLELLLASPPGHLHTDLVIARMARPAVALDSETLAAQLHEAARLLERIEQAADAAQEGVPAGAAPNPHQEAAHMRVQHPGQAHVSEPHTQASPAEASSLRERSSEERREELGAEELRTLAAGPQPAQAAFEDATGGVGAEAQGGPPGSFHDLSDLADLAGGRSFERAADTAAGGPTPQDEPRPAAREAEQDDSLVAAFVQAAARRSVLAGAVARGASTRVDGTTIHVSGPEGLYQRARQVEHDLEDAARSVGALLRLERADA